MSVEEGVKSKQHILWYNCMRVRSWGTLFTTVRACNSDSPEQVMAIMAQHKS